MGSEVPFNDLRRRPAGDYERLSAVAERVISSGWYLLGPETEAFEQEFAAFCEAGGAVAVANGTDALEIALRSAGCTEGDEVVLTANAGAYATTACFAIGAVPVFADVEPTSLLIDLEATAAQVTARTRAVVATHLYGNVVDVDRLRGAVPAGVAIVEDCAQAHGAESRGRRVGSLGDVAAFSFYPTKNLGAMGDGGAVTSDDAALLARARALRQYGWESRYLATVPGGRNSRIDELQAAFLRDQLPSVIARNARRAAIRDRYLEALGRVLDFVGTPPDTRSATHLCVLRTEGRDRLLADLAAEGVSCAVHYPVPDHEQPAFQARSFRHDGLAETTRACAEVLSLPCFPDLRDDEVDRVVEAVGRVVR